jgi:hypothetical protein
MAMPIDAGTDDLPRTLRRAREERMREAEAEQAALHQPSLSSAPGHHAPTGYHPVVEPLPAAPRTFGEPSEAVTVDAINIPFFRLMTFFIKAVFAAIPALLILGAVLWGIGKGLQTFFPTAILIETKIFHGAAGASSPPVNGSPSTKAR